jgi:uncharacterized protein YecT (DUF1311 family)
VFATRVFSAVAVLAVIAALAAEAKMLDPGFLPCGEKTSRLEVIECLRAKTNIADQRLNAA